MMIDMKNGFATLLVAATAFVAFAQGSAPVFQNDFEKAALDKVPEDFLVLDGGFAVKQDGTNKFLELPGAPLELFGVLFGPNSKTNIAVSARIFGTAKGRRMPAFAVGLSGVGGYKLQVSAGKKLVELYKGDAVQASAPFEWESGKWTQLRLQVRKTGEGVIVEGKLWKAGEPEPRALVVTWKDSEEPIAGRASVWGSPYSGTPIRFDDLMVAPATAK